MENLELSGIMSFPHQVTGRTCKDYPSSPLLPHRSQIVLNNIIDMILQARAQEWKTATPLLMAQKSKINSCRSQYLDQCHGDRLCHWEIGRYTTRKIDNTSLLLDIPMIRLLLQIIRPIGTLLLVFIEYVVAHGDVFKYCLNLFMKT